MGKCFEGAEDVPFAVVLTEHEVVTLKLALQKVAETAPDNTHEKILAARLVDGFDAALHGRRDTKVRRVSGVGYLTYLL